MLRQAEDEKEGRQRRLSPGHHTLQLVSAVSVGELKYTVYFNYSSSMKSHLAT